MYAVACSSAVIHTASPALPAGLFGQGRGWSPSWLLTAANGESFAMYGTVCSAVFRKRFEGEAKPEVPRNGGGGGGVGGWRGASLIYAILIDILKA